MTLKELREIVDECCDGCGDPENITVEIPYEPSVPMMGGTTAVPVSGAGMGFDWDDGRFFLFPKHKMRLVEQEGLK